MTACEILKYSDAYIELVIEVENCTKDELRKIEGQYIREMKCINKRIEGRTQDESRKQYYTENKDKINEQKKEHYTENKDEILKKANEYYTENKDKILEQMSTKYLCECGKELSHGHKSRHDKVCKFNSKAI